MARPLEGVRVIELAAHIAGPACGRLLSDLGAEVIKIESAKGDPWRVTGRDYCPNRYDIDLENPSFDICNTGKKSIELDLKSDFGREAAQKLLGSADVFVTNFRPAALKRLGLHYEQVCPRYPGLIYGMSLGFGEKGPEAEKKAMDVTAFWARTGFLRDMNPIEIDEPFFPPWCVGDTAVGTQMALSIVAAYVNKLKTGKGDVVKAGLMQESVYLFGHMITICQPPYGKQFPQSIYDHALDYHFKCSDDIFVMVSLVGGNEAILQLFRMLGLSEWCEDERYNTYKARKERIREIYDKVREKFREKTSTEWNRLAAEFDVALTIMPHYRDMANDEQAWANGYLEKVEYPNGNVDVVPASVFDMGCMEKKKTEQAHAIGADTDEVLASIGMKRPE